MIAELVANPLLWLVAIGYGLVRIEEWRFHRAQTLLRQLEARRRMTWESWGLIAITALLVASLHAVG
ncbi:hypothetical protein EPN42_04800 [bacterium]|nr:MAG: hypothetical protein EPN42_04800 [bacterium]